MGVSAISLGGVEITDPRTFLRECKEKNLPTAWFRQANVLNVPHGTAPGSGRLLMLGRHLAALKADAAGPPSFAWGCWDADGNRFVLSGYSVVSAFAVSPGKPGDPNNLYLVEVADRRYRARRRSSYTKAYNFRDSQGAYRPGTLKAGSPWTWQELLADLWPAEFGAVPAIPYTPHGVPENLAYVGMSKPDALANLLVRLGLTLRHDPTSAASPFSVRRYGPASTDQSAKQNVDLLSRPPSVILWDHFGYRPDSGAYPEKVRVMFRLTCSSDGSPPWCWVDVTTTEVSVDGNPSKVASGEYVTLWDDLMGLPPASGSGGGSGQSGSGAQSGSGGVPCNEAGVTNLTELTNRAKERAHNWVRARAAEYPFGRVYKGLKPPALAALGGAYHHLALEDFGGGWRTHLSTDPNLTAQLEGWRPHDPCWPCCDVGTMDCGEGAFLDSIEELCFVPPSSGSGSQSGSG